MSGLTASRLTWKRGTFPVWFLEESSGQWKHGAVSGLVAGPFGVFRNRWLTPDAELRFVLSLLPCQQILFILNRSRDCRREAERLAGLDVDWHAKDPKLVTGPEVGVAAEILTRLRGTPVKAAGPV